MKLLTFLGDVMKAPTAVLKRMNEEKSEFVTWTNSFTSARFITKKETVEKLSFNKSNIEKKEILDGEIVKISNVNLTNDEVLFELDANNCDEMKIKEGFGKTVKITRKDINYIDEILFNKNFDYNSLFKKSVN